MFEDEKLQVTGTVTNIPVVKATVQNHDGYLVVIGKYGIFAYHDKGVWRGNPFDKIRICVVYKARDGNIYMQRNELVGKELERKRLSMLERIGVRIELVAPLITLLSMLIKDLDTSAIEGLEEVQTKQQEDAEIDALLKDMGQII